MALNPWEYADKTGNEHAHQTALFMLCARARFTGFDLALDRSKWLKGASYTYTEAMSVPALRWLHAIHNQGHGDVKRGARARAEGVRAGVPDLFLPVPKHRSADVFHCGLYIELKRPDSVGKKAGSASDIQNEWLDYLKSAGYQVEVCYGWLEAVACIRKYLGV